MKPILLLGDSIRMGYQNHVAEALRDVADVWGPEENCRHSAFSLERLTHWLGGRERPHLVHVNAGLHDLAASPEGQPQVNIEAYRRNVGEMLRRIRQETGAITIWASITPVLNDRVLKSKGYQFRPKADVERYNAAALAAALEAEVEIDDLHEAVLQAGAERFLGEDGIHFTHEGYEMLGRVVAGSIRRSIDQLK